MHNRSHALSIVGILATGVSCSSGPSEPAGAVTFTAPSEARGTFATASRGDRYRFVCDYQVDPHVTGAASATLVGARYELTSTPDAVVPFRYTGVVPAESLATLFRVATLVPKHVGSTLRTFVEFDRSIEPRGAGGPHDARWVMTYTIGTHRDSTSFTVRCLPVVVSALDVIVTSRELGRVISGAQVMIGKRTGTTTSFGQVRFDTLVAGRQTVSVRLDGFVPVDTTIDHTTLSFIDINLKPIAVRALSQREVGIGGQQGLVALRKLPR